MANVIEVEDELKKSFEKTSKTVSVSLSMLFFLIIFCLLIILGIILRLHIRSNDKYHGVSMHLTSILYDDKTVSLKKTKVVKIPQEVYDSISKDPLWKESLLGKKKHVVFIYWDGCQYAREFKSNLDSVFLDNKILDNYEKNIYYVKSFNGFSCSSVYCPRLWLHEYCANGFCIVNPITKEIISDESQNSSQMFILMNAYADRYDNKILE